MQRVSKWKSRNESLVRAIAVTTAIVVAVAGVLLWRERTRTLAALERETEQRGIVEQQRAAAETNLHNAQEAVDRYLTLVSQSKLLDVPKLAPLREKLLTAAIDYYEDFANQRTDDPQLRWELAMAHRRVMDVKIEMNLPWFGRLQEVCRRD